MLLITKACHFQRETNIWVNLTYRAVHRDIQGEHKVFP